MELSESPKNTVYPETAIDYRTHGEPWGCEQLQELMDVGIVSRNTSGGLISFVDAKKTARVYRLQNDRLELIHQWQQEKNVGFGHVVINAEVPTLLAVQGGGIRATSPESERFLTWHGIEVHDLCFSEALRAVFISYYINDDGMLGKLDLESGKIVDSILISTTPNEELNRDIELAAHPTRPVIAVNWVEPYLTHTRFVTVGDEMILEELSIDPDDPMLGFDSSGEMIAYRSAGVYYWESGEFVYTPLWPEEDGVLLYGYELGIASPYSCWVGSDLAIIFSNNVKIAPEVSSSEEALIVFEGGKHPKLTKMYHQKIESEDGVKVTGTVPKSAMSPADDLLIVCCDDNAQLLRIDRS